MYPPARMSTAEPNGSLDGRLSVVPRPEASSDGWEALVTASSTGWLWHGDDYLDALTTWPDRSDHSFAIIDPTGRLIAAVPLGASRARIKGVLTMTKLESNGGPAFAADIDPDLVAAAARVITATIAQRASSLKAVAATISFVPPRPDDSDWVAATQTILQAMQLVPIDAWSWVVDLRAGEDVVWRSMQKRARTAVRKATKAGAIVREARGDDDLDAYYRLHEETYARSNIRPHPIAYFRELWTRFIDRNRAFALIAELEGDVVAAQTFAVWEGHAVYWTGCSSEIALGSGANNLLQWEAMRWMIERDIEWYETGEAFPDATSGKEKGLNDFKKGMGGTLTRVPTGKLRLGTARARAWDLVDRKR